MGMYWKSCPHCGRTVQHGHGSPKQHFGNPEKLCRFCGNIYTDGSIIDWPRASIFRKLSYCFANGRIWLCVFPYMISTAIASTRLNWELPWLCCLPVFLLAFALCLLYVRAQVLEYYGDNREMSNATRIFALVVLYIVQAAKIIFLVAMAILFLAGIVSLFL